MLLFITMPIWMFLDWLGFNTSHVTLYLSNVFIIDVFNTCFNTSHVTLYRWYVLYSMFGWDGFNTSHVTLYHYQDQEGGIWFEFQYISCYSLSGFMGNGQNIIKRFNTSHVTLYRNTRCGGEGKSIVSIHLMLLFIELRKQLKKAKEGFQYISCYSLSESPSDYKFERRVSIHLMLLFIHSGWLQEEMEKRFQYISCYSLSFRRWCGSVLGRVSIHLMLLFIGIPAGIQKRRIKVSIHLMLLFISKATHKDYQGRTFQDISCYSLSRCCEKISHKCKVSIHLMLLFIK